MAIRNLVTSSSSSSYYSLESYTREDVIDLEESARMLMVSIESDANSIEHAANAADAMSGVLEVAESNGGEVTENEASLIDDVNTAVSGSSTSDDPPVSISSESNGRYYISTEDILENIRDIWEKIKIILSKAWTALKEAFDKYFDFYKSLNKRANEIKITAKLSYGKYMDSKIFEYTTNTSILYLGSDKITNNTQLIKALNVCKSKVSLDYLSYFNRIADEFIKMVDCYKGDPLDNAMVEHYLKNVLNLVHYKVIDDKKIPDFVGGKKLYQEYDFTYHVDDGWLGVISSLFYNETSYVNASTNKVDSSIDFSTLDTKEVSNICDIIIGITDTCIELTSKNGLTSLFNKKDKLEDASHKLSKRYQDALSNKEFNDDNGNAKFLKLLKVSGYYAHSVSVFTKLLQLNGSFCTASLNLCTKSLSQHV